MALARGWLCQRYLCLAHDCWSHQSSFSTMLEGHTYSVRQTRVKSDIMVILTKFILSWIQCFGEISRIDCVDEVSAIATRAISLTRSSLDRLSLSSKQNWAKYTSLMTSVGRLSSTTDDEFPVSCSSDSIFSVRLRFSEGSGCSVTASVALLTSVSPSECCDFSSSSTTVALLTSE